MFIPISKPIIEKEETAGVNKVLKSGMLAQGQQVAELEKKFAQYCGTKYAIAVSSGTAAIHAALYALGIRAGDEVITTPFTFVATANPILMQGAKVVFADISEEDFNLDPQAVIPKITPRTRAILPVDLYGQIYSYPALKKIAQQHKLKIIEDACQAIGATYKDKKAGNFGDAAAFSLYATKNIMSGEGGLVTTNNTNVAELCRRFRHHGQSEKTRYQYWDLGYNYRLTDLAAAIALAQLRKAERFNHKRRVHAQKLMRGLSEIKGIILPQVKKGYTHVFHQFTIRVTKNYKLKRDTLIAYLQNHQIGCGIYYPKPLHLHPHFKRLGYRPQDFPVAEKMAREVLALPVHPALTAQNLNYIIQTIKSA